MTRASTTAGETRFARPDCRQKTRASSCFQAGSRTGAVLHRTDITSRCTSSSPLRCISACRRLAAFQRRQVFLFALCRIGRLPGLTGRRARTRSAGLLQNECGSTLTDRRLTSQQAQRPLELTVSAGEPDRRGMHDAAIGAHRGSIALVARCADGPCT